MAKAQYIYAIQTEGSLGCYDITGEAFTSEEEARQYCLEGDAELLAENLDRDDIARLFELKVSKIRKMDSEDLAELLVAQHNSGKVNMFEAMEFWSHDCQQQGRHYYEVLKIEPKEPEDDDAERVRPQTQRVVVLSDGDTFSGIEDCMVVEIPADAAETVQEDPKLLRDPAAQGWEFRYIEELDDQHQPTQE